jgi:prophage DNA circulation protein
MGWRERQLFFPEDGRGNLKLEDGYEFASFKGVVFWVESYNLDGGRRQSVQKFPGDQYTNVQDLGRDSSTITVNAFLVGEHYDLQLRSLEVALLQGGPGELSLPWRAPFNVTVVGRIRVDETKGARGFATVSFDCVETAEPPSAFGQDSAARMRESAEGARSATRDRFGDAFNAADQPESFRTRVRDSMNDASAKIVGVQGRVDGFIGEISKGANTINRLSGTVNDLINTPLDLSDAIVDAVITAYSSLTSTLQTAQSVIETWGKGGPVRILKDQVFTFNNDFAPVTVDTTTPGGAIEQQNLDEFNRLCRLNMFYEMALLLGDLQFESYSQATGLRTEFVNNIDGLLLGATPAEADRIAGLVEATGAFLEEVAEGLPRLGVYISPVTMPALVVAHTIYGDARAQTDIVLRNNIRHPGFVEAGVELEVLDAGL